MGLGTLSKAGTGPLIPRGLQHLNGIWQPRSFVQSVTCHHFFILSFETWSLTWDWKDAWSWNDGWGTGNRSWVWAFQLLPHRGKSQKGQGRNTASGTDPEDRGIILCVHWTNTYQVIAIYQALARYIREQDRYNSALLRQAWPADIYNKRVRQHIYVIRTLEKKTKHHERGKETDVGGECLERHHCDSNV